ncbi:hypothetical protein GF325_18650 [Candidatus Bathyarchaeota archaeon]|nr:hypothetical protein [Candidatus Bathyarchaeota archaeon]
MNFWNIFQVGGFSWVAFILLLVFSAFLVIGYIIIRKEIKVIKEKGLTHLDHVLSVLFGFIFSASATLGVSIGIQYSSAAIASISTTVQPVLTPAITIGIFMMLYGILMVFPLLEFLWLALDYKGNSVFSYQDLLGRHVTKKAESKVIRGIVAIGLYFSIFLLLPMILQLTVNVSFLVTTLTLAQAFPVFTLSKFGSDGYFWGVNLHYYNILEKDRLFYTLFDNKKEFGEKFESNPVAILAVPIMIYVYVNSYLSLQGMIELLVRAATNSPATNEIGFSFLVSTITNILLVLVGYYNKYWKKQVKYKFTEILLAGYLFASLAMNIFLNFYVKQPGVLLQDLKLAFNGTDAEINQLFHPAFMIPVAMIQKVVFVIFVTYYFLNRGSQYRQNVITSIMMVARNRLNPKPLINLLRHRNPILRKEAKIHLEEMYRRYGMKYIPPPGEKQDEGKPSILKKFIQAISPPKLKQAPFVPVIASLDSDHVEIREEMGILLNIMAGEDPSQVAELFNEHVVSSPSKKKIKLLKVLGLLNENGLERVDMGRVLDAVENGSLETRCAFYGSLQHLWKHVLKESALVDRILAMLRVDIKSPSMQVQASTLAFLDAVQLEGIKDELPTSLFLKKLNHPNQDIKQEAIQLCNNLQEGGGALLGEEQIMEFLQDSNPRMQNAALNALLAMNPENLPELDPSFLMNLCKSNDSTVSRNATRLVLQLAGKDAGSFPPATLLEILGKKDVMFLKGILEELEPAILAEPDLAIDLLGKVMEKGTMELKERGKELLVKLGNKHLDTVIEAIKTIKVDSRFAVRNFTNEILTELGRIAPDSVIPKLELMLFSGTKDGSKQEQSTDKKKRRTMDQDRPGDNNGESTGDESKLSWWERRKRDRKRKKEQEQEEELQEREITTGKEDGMEKSVMESTPSKEGVKANFRMNIATVLGNLGQKFPDKVNISRLLEHALGESNWRIRSHLATSIGKLIPATENFPMDTFLQLVKDKNDKVRNAALKGLLACAKDDPAVIPTEELVELAHDEDEFCRENFIKIMGEASIEDPDVALPLLIAGLNDEKWSVRNAAASAIGNASRKAPEKIPGSLLLEILLHDDDKWARWQAANSLTEIIKVRPETVTLENLSGNLRLVDDENLAIAVANLLRHVKPEPMNLFVTIITTLMDHQEEKVQEQVANTLYQVHGKTKSDTLVSELLKRVGKEFSIPIQRVAAMALGRMVKYDKGDLHKRVKKVLGARCKQSRDPVICREFSAL